MIKSFTFFVERLTGLLHQGSSESTFSVLGVLFHIVLAFQGVVLYTLLSSAGMWQCYHQPH